MVYYTGDIHGDPMRLEVFCHRWNLSVYYRGKGTGKRRAARGEGRCRSGKQSQKRIFGEYVSRNPYPY